ncbi:MAG TPA: M3 family metallopeptidase, partial [Flavobacterium sp.]
MKILTTHFTTKHNTAPFSQIRTEDFKPAFEKAIEMGRGEIHAIIENPDAPTFQNTIEALDFSGETLDRLSSIFFNLNSAETNDEIQKIAQEVSPLLTAFSNDITLNEDLFKKVKSVYEKRHDLNLNAEQMMLLEKKFKGFARNGALLSEEKKLRLREIDTELARLKLTYGENVLAETHNYQLRLKNETDLKGLPEGAIEEARSLAKSQDKEGWIFTLDHPSYIPFVTYAENRELRKELAIAAGKKAFQANQYNNVENVKRIASLRFERANLLGYSTHSHFVLEERMAQNPEKVKSFLKDLLGKAKPAAQREFAEMASFANELDGISQLEKWDGGYYSEKLKQKLFDFDDEQLKPYFKLENVLNGAYTVAEKLFGITFKEVFDIDKYHEEVQTFEVLDFENQLIAVFYTDF